MLENGQTEKAFWEKHLKLDFEKILAQWDEKYNHQERKFKKPKTKIISELLKAHGIYNKKILILFENKNDNLEISCRNIKWLLVKRSILVNPFDLIWADFILITPDALQKIEEVLGK